MSKGKKNTGLEFEKLTESIFNKLASNEEFTSVEHNVMLEGLDGKRQIDILIRSKVAQIQVITVIECKDYNHKLSVGKVDEFHSKLLDVKANKGILISKKGFSSKCISKAKRLGISLYTAHEAASGKWEPDIDIPILFEEIKPVDIVIQGDIEFDSDDVVFKKKIPPINGIDIPSFVDGKWRKKEIKFNKTTDYQAVIFDELKPPYVVEIQSKIGPRKKEVSNLEILLKLDITGYVTSSSSIEGTQILNSYTEDDLKLFLEIPSFKELKISSKKVGPKEISEFSGIKASLLITPKFKEEADSFSLKRIR